MAAVTGPGLGGPAAGVARRRWLGGLVTAWIVVVTGLAVWSVRHSPATVAEQRGIGVAVAELRKATGAVFAAASGDGRAVVLGELRVVTGCRITPLRQGQSATRDVAVHVRDGEARAALDAVAAALPAGYRAEVSASRAATRLFFHADAGDFIGIDADADATAEVLDLELSTGCRPPGRPDRADPPAAPAPASLATVLAALAAPATPPAVASVACPDGGVAATYTVDGVPAPADLRRSLRAATAGATVLRSDASTWIYRTGPDSVLVLPTGRHLQVIVTTGC